MKDTIELVQDLRKVPEEVYEEFCDRAKIISLRYPFKHGIDCFARGESIECGFIRIIGKYVDLVPNKKTDFNDPDGIYSGSHLTDIKSKVRGFEPQAKNPKKFYSKRWDIKKTSNGSVKFESKAHSYILIDPNHSRIAVVESKLLYKKKMAVNKARISFSLKYEDVYMVYDGIKNVKDFSVSPNNGQIVERIWDESKDYKDYLVDS